MSAPLTDRRRVEFALPAVLAYAVVQAGLVVPEGVDQAERDKSERLHDLIKRACFEPIDDLPAREKGKLARRITRTSEDVLRFLADPTTDKLGMVLLYLLEGLTARGALDLIEGSTFAEAMGLLLPALDHAFAEGAFAASARKQARRLDDHLRGLGLYG